jgi:outer membrane lipoprotein-sorting protein
MVSIRSSLIVLSLLVLTVAHGQQSNRPHLTSPWQGEERRDFPLLTKEGLGEVSLLQVSSKPLLSESEQREFSRAFSKKQKQLKSFQADLKQTLLLEGIRDPVKSVGRIYYQAPDSLLIDFAQPKGEFMLIRGTELYVKKSGKSLLRRKLGDGPGETNMLMLLALFQNGAVENENFEVSMDQVKDRLFVKLIPKELENKRVLQIENELSLPDLSVRSIKVTFGESNVIRYELSNQKRNPKLSEDLFVIPQ